MSESSNQLTYLADTPAHFWYSSHIQKPAAPRSAPFPERDRCMAKKNRALITGVTGQDGSYLAEFLLGRGYDVIGMVRRSSTVNFERIAHIQDRLTLVAGDLLDEVSLIS